MKNKSSRLKSFKDFNEDTKKPCVIFVGPPGCGKGTQAEILKKKTGWNHISTGEILRKSDDEEIKKMMKTGKLLPDDLVAKELEKFLKKSKKSKGFIFDGYPRNIDQKYLFDEIIKSNDIKISAIFYLNVSEKTLKERIKERGKTSGRSDDKDEDVFKTRMKEYYTKTFPMIESMKNDENFVEVSGDLSLEEASAEIEKHII